MRKPAKKAIPSWYVRDWLKLKGLRQTDLVAKTGHDKAMVSLWVSGKRRFNADVLRQFADAIGVSTGDLLRPPMASSGQYEGLLVGKVGAGAEVSRFEEGTVLAGIPLPPGLGPNVADIEGDSQYPYLRHGWRVTYGPENQGVQDRLIGELCIVQVHKGPILLKTLQMGSKKGLWDLESWNAPARKDVKLDWAAKVNGILPR